MQSLICSRIACQVWFWLVLLLVAFPAVAVDTQRPSIALILVDTLRADAVSAYGEVEGTTPVMDRLARGGLRYERAYAPAPWTLPSHATLLSGLGVERHRVSMPGRALLPEDVLTLAERLRDAGYETAAFSENSIVSDTFQLLQGFDHRRTSYMKESGIYVELELLPALKKWVEQRDATRPFFVFVNMIDPHETYEIRAENRFVPADASASEIASRPKKSSRLLCGGLPNASQIAVLHGLYLGDVSAADQKVGKILRLLRNGDNGAKGDGARDLITVVTSDHGEYFGEDKLMGHQFGLHAAVLKVPLIVHGLAGAEPSVITDVVGLEDIAPSILEWTGTKATGELSGQALPQTPGRAAKAERISFAAWTDTPRWMPELWRREFVSEDLDQNRQFCAESDRVFGRMASILQHPFKFRWYERHPPQLYDLSWDPNERSDQARHQPEQVEKFMELIRPYLDAAGLEGEVEADAEPLSEQAVESLRALGYVE